MDFYELFSIGIRAKAELMKAGRAAANSRSPATQEPLASARQDEPEPENPDSDPARNRWRRQVTDVMLEVCDEILAMASEASGRPCQLTFLRTLIRVMAEGDDRARVWIVPMRQVVRVGAYVDEPKRWLERLQQYNLLAELVRGDRAVETTFEPMSLYLHAMALSEFISDAYASPRFMPNPPPSKDVMTRDNRVISGTSLI